MADEKTMEAAAGRRPWWRLSLTGWILVGLVLGGLLGYLRPDWGNAVFFLRDIFLNLIKSIIAPLVDRKSTRLNSSHDQISYAVFCLKSEDHTSELQSRSDLVCRLLLEKQRGVVPRTRGRRIARAGALRHPTLVRLSTAPHAGVSRDLARRRAGGGGPARGGGRADLRHPLSAAQVQGRVRVPGRQLLRRALERPRLPGRDGTRSPCRLQPAGGRGHGENAREGRHVSTARRYVGLRQDGGRRRGGGGGGEGAA